MSYSPGKSNDLRKDKGDILDFIKILFIKLLYTGLELTGVFHVQKMSSIHKRAILQCIQNIAQAT